MASSAPRHTSQKAAPSQKTSPRMGDQAGRPLHIVIVTDAAPPQVNGVVRTLRQTSEELQRLGHKVDMITPEDFRTVPLPSYKEIRIALRPYPRIARLLDRAKPDAIHIATEGPLGHAARRYCLSRGLPFTTSFHTRFPEYLHARTRFPQSWSYAYVRRFHAPSSSVMVATPTLRQELEERGFTNLKLWSRGVDTELFRPRPELREGEQEQKRPLWLYVGRVAVEKNIDAFLETDLPGAKMVVGDGPRLEHLKKKFRDVAFTGALFGDKLAEAFARADCFVFPSRTDTFGLVLVEALASGTPVAAYPVQGPIDIITDPATGCLDADLRTACLTALEKGDREACRVHALSYSWEACTRQFLSNLVLIDREREAGSGTLESAAAQAKAPVPA